MADVKSLIREAAGISKTLPTKSIYAQDWLSWYRGNVRHFHNYRVYNGTNYLNLIRKTLMMPKFVCETWANLLLNERCEIVIPDDDKKKLDDILTATNFWQKANEGVEKSFALGIGALVVNVKGAEIGDKGTIKKEKAKVTVDFVNETRLYPITIEDMNVTECAFVTKMTDETKVVIHQKVDGIYVIKNTTFNKDGKITLQYDFDTKSELPWFFIIRPNVASNFLTDIVDEEIGISIFANSLDVFKAIDNKYDGFDLEYVLGRKKTFISVEAWTVNKEDGTPNRTFDPYDQLYYHLPENDEDKPLITEQGGDLRFDAYIKGINAELAFLSMKCGLGEGFFKFDGSSIATATQVISENSTLFRNIKKHEILLEQVLINLTKVIKQASNDFTMTQFSDFKDEDITIQFDDSIIEDRNAEMERDRADLTAGIMSVVEYRMKWYGEDEKTATEKYQTQFLHTIINNYLTALTTGAITVEQYVDKVFPNAKDRDAIILYVTEFIGTADEYDPYAGDEDDDNSDDDNGDNDDNDENEEEEEDNEDEE